MDLLYESEKAMCDMDDHDMSDILDNDIFQSPPTMVSECSISIVPYGRVEIKKTISSVHVNCFTVFISVLYYFLHQF